MKYETVQLRKKDIRSKMKVKVDIRKCARCERCKIALNSAGICMRCYFEPRIFEGVE